MKIHHLIRIFALFTLACATLSLAACGQTAEEKDTGPNANLSNEELLKKAIANMKTLKSYHFNFKGGLPSESVQMSTNLSITANIQLDERGSTIKMKDNGEVLGGPYLMLGVGSGLEVTITKDAWYESFDEGETWYKATTDTPGGFLMAMFGWLWDNRSSEDSSKYPTTGERLVEGLTFEDGAPRIERIDGVITRRMVADFDSAGRELEGLMSNNQWEGARTVSIWVTSEMTPTIRQMRVEGSNIVKRNEIGSANSVAFSPDGKALAVGHGHSQDLTVRVWDLTRPGSTPKKLSGESGAFLAVAFSPDGKTLAAGAHASGAPTKLYLWDMGNLDAAPTTLQVASSVSSVAFRPDGKMLAAAGSDGVYIWEPPYSSAKPTVIPYSERNVVYSVAFSPDNHTLATGNLIAGIRLHDVRYPQAEPTVLPQEEVRSVTFSPDGHLLAASRGVWDMSKPDALPVFLTDNQVVGDTIAFSPDGRRLAASGQEGSIRLWNTDSLQSSPVMLGGEWKGTIQSVAFSPDSKQLAAAVSNGEVQIWDVQDAQSKATPTILKENELPTDTPYTLTWKWSRFNEDFGEVKAPPAETIKNP